MLKGICVTFIGPSFERSDFWASESMKTMLLSLYEMPTVSSYVHSSKYCSAPWPYPSSDVLAMCKNASLAAQNVPRMKPSG